MSDDERIQLTPEQAEALLPDGEQVHTYRQAGFTLIGAHWTRDELLAAFRKHTPELSGHNATNMHHGIVFCDEHGYVFVETKPKEQVTV